MMKDETPMCVNNNDLIYHMCSPQATKVEKAMGYVNFKVKGNYRALKTDRIELTFLYSLYLGTDQNVTLVVAALPKIDLPPVIGSVKSGEPLKVFVPENSDQSFYAGDLFSIQENPESISHVQTWSTGECLFGSLYSISRMCNMMIISEMPLQFCHPNCAFFVPFPLAIGVNSRHCWGRNLKNISVEIQQSDNEPFRIQEPGN